MLFRKSLAITALLGCCAQFAFADTIQLKDATVTGKILAEKPDSLIVDVGFTVLQVPRSAIISVTKASTATMPATTTTTPSANGRFLFFRRQSCGRA